MAYQLFRTESCRPMTPAQRRLVTVLVLLASAASSLQGQKPAAAPTAPPLATVKPSPTVNPGPFRLDHFLCYMVEPTQFPGRPGLSFIDQFSPKPRPFALATRELLCNPVSKNNEPILNKQNHLTGYVVKPMAVAGVPSLNIPVVVGNQFGQGQRYVVLEQTKFLVPTGKAIMIPGQEPAQVPPIPPRFDHYACYAVKAETQFQPRGVVLQDQFGRTEGEVYQPSFLCNPAEKLIEGKSTGPLVNNRDHLMCYAIKAGFQPKKALIHNQFEPRVAVEAVRPEVLCLPSTKQPLRILPGGVKEPVKP
jgi:hypothetical protein